MSLYQCKTCEATFTSDQVAEMFPVGSPSTNGSTLYLTRDKRGSHELRKKAGEAVECEPESEPASDLSALMSEVLQ